MTKRLWLLAAAASLALEACGGSPGLSGSSGMPVLPTAQALVRSGAIGPGAPLPEAPEVDAVHGVATVVLSSVVDPSTAMPTFLYLGQKDVAPTIVVTPGDTIVVDVANALPASAGMAGEMNLHFHGLTVSPEAPADDVLTTLAMPGGSLHYVVKIPTTQEPGLYWYHPHVHGVTNYQVGESGMSGAIVVNGLKEHLPGLAAMTEHVVVIRDVAATAADAISTAGRRRRPADLDTNTNPCGPDPGLTVTLNGAVQPSIAIARGESQFFRVVNATGHKNLNLAVDGGTLEVVAIDGVALDAYPGTASTQVVSNLVVPPAGRAEFVVTGTGAAGAFRTLCFNSGPTGDPDPEIVLASFKPGAGARALSGVAPPRLRAGAPLPASPFSQTIPTAAAHRTVVLSEDDNGMYVNGQAFSMGAPPMFTVHTGTVEQWQVVNITEEVHDFHIHQTHFFVQSINGAGVQHPHWSDSVVVPHRIPGKNGSWTPGYLTMIVDFRNPVMKGEFVFHCHILDHEDSGMMAKILAL